MKPDHVAPEAMSLELTINHDERSYIVGDAWGHVAPRFEDLEVDWARIVDRGALDYRDPASCDFQYAFTKLPDGQEIEMVRNQE
jgi:lactoylglutathione lyase